jgi:hypothetical protein
MSFEDISAVLATRMYGAFGINYKHIDYGDINGYDAAGNSTPYVVASVNMFATGWGSRFSSEYINDISFGINLKYASEKLSGVTAGSFMFDVGLFTGLYDKLSFGIVAKNMGQDIKFDRENESLPQAFEFGFGWETLKDKLIIAADFHKPKNENLYTTAGLEYRLTNIFLMRVGYRANVDEGPGINAGFSILLNKIKIDYAWVPYGDLGNSHVISIVLNFKPKGDDRKNNFKINEKIKKMRSRYE